MIAAAYVWRWTLAHPVILFVWGALAIACVLTVTAYYWATSEPKAPRRETRSRARGTRTRRAVATARRRVRATIRRSTGWARQTISLHVHGIEIDLTAPAAGDDTQRSKSPDRGTPDPGLPGATTRRSAQPPPPQDIRQPTRKATEDECRDARLDYAPAAPFTDWESDTFVGGIPAIKEA